MDDIYKLISEAYDKCEAKIARLSQEGKDGKTECAMLDKVKSRLSQAADDILEGKLV